MTCRKTLANSEAPQSWWSGGYDGRRAIPILGRSGPGAIQDLGLALVDYASCAQMDLALYLAMTW